MDRSKLNHIGVIVRANRDIGTGHLMRIRPLLAKLKPHSYLTLYVYAFDKVLMDLCLEYDQIHTFEHKEDILCHLKTKIANNSLDHLFIIDDYAIDKSFEKELYPYSKIFIIDDLANRDHQCHMLLDQTVITREVEYQKLCPNDCLLLLGAKYALTKECFYPQFFAYDNVSSCTCGGHSLPLSARSLKLAQKYNIKIKNQEPSSKDTFKKVLVNFGGADPVSACVTTCRSILEGKLYLHYEFYILTGSANKDIDKLKELISSLEPPYKDRIKLLYHCNDVADLLYRFDFAIGAYGGMFRERIATAIPTIGVEIADNQAGTMAIVEKFNIGLSLILEELKDSEILKNKLQKLEQNASLYTNNCQLIYDGQGLERVASHLLSLLN